MKREWFEPGPDGESPFVKATLKTPAEMPVWETISAAFRALLTEEQVAPVELRVGDVVRLEDPGTFCFLKFIGVKATITGFRNDGNPKFTSSLGNSWWPASACTLIRRAGEEQHDERDALIAQLRAEVERLTAERDALQARIDAGVRVWGDHLVWGQLEEHDTHTGIVIDVEKIRHDVVEMADERKTPGTRADRRAS